MYAYAFEARSIQSWILQGGRLADMVAASDIVDQLSTRLVDCALEALDLDDGPQLRVARRAGGALYAVADERTSVEKLHDLMALIVPPFAPGLEFIHAVAAGNSDHDALQAALETLQTMRNRPAATLPQAGPLVEREARTGEPAVTIMRRGAERKRGAIGAATQAKRSPDLTPDRLSERFIPAGLQGAANWVWPRNMEAEDDDEMHAFPFLRDQSLVGIIHADGNGLGQILLTLQATVSAASGLDYAALFRDFSDRVERATLLAAQCATEQVLIANAVDARDRYGRRVRKLPARPLVLGGDDLSIIVRADLAIPFTKAFLRAFEHTTQTELSAWRSDARWSSLFASPAGQVLARLDRMTACAGIAFVHASQPFETAYSLAEDLCQSAKSASTRAQDDAAVKPASLRFYLLTNSMIEDAAVFAGTVRLGTGSDTRVACLRLPAYGLQDGTALPSLDALENLATLLDTDPTLAVGGLRQLLGVMQEDPIGAQALYRRWRQVRQQPALTQFDTALQALGPTATTHDLPLIRLSASVSEAASLASPLEDVFDLLAVSARAVATTEESQ